MTAVIVYRKGEARRREIALSGTREIPRRLPAYTPENPLDLNEGDVVSFPAGKNLPTDRFIVSKVGTHGGYPSYWLKRLKDPVKPAEEK